MDQLREAEEENDDDNGGMSLSSIHYRGRIDQQLGISSMADDHDGLSQFQPVGREKRGAQSPSPRLCRAGCGTTFTEPE